MFPFPNQLTALPVDFEDAFRATVNSLKADHISVDDGLGRLSRRLLIQSPILRW